MNVAVCKTCKFWWPDRDSNTTGECRIRSPQRLMDLNLGLWPKTFSNHWCGEHNPMDDAVYPLPTMMR